jgi:hypothetical protein
VRWLALVAGAALLVLAFAAAGRVTDTREGLVAEVVTLIGGATGFLLLIYAFAARKRAASPPSPAKTAAPRAEYRRTTRDVLLGGGGIAVAMLLVAGLAVSGGPMLAGFGLALLLPMLAGSVYLCVRYLRASP